jgi:hypothetical protein
MITGRSALTIFACVCLLTFTGRMVKQAFGAPKTTKEQASPAVAVKAVKPTSEQIQKPASKIVSSTGLQRPSKTVQKSPRQESPAEPKPMASKSGLQVKVRKKVMPKAVVQPRTDLMYYGILEDSQRYDPRPNPHNAGVPSPQSSDLTHEHFQELDRNQDGMIDPVERAVGRLDIDRDLSNRQFR